MYLPHCYPPLFSNKILYTITSFVVYMKVLGVQVIEVIEFSPKALQHQGCGPQPCYPPQVMRFTVFEIRLSNLLARKLEYLYRFYRKNLAKITGPNQFSLAVGHWTTAKVDDWVYKHLLMKQDFTCQFYSEYTSNYS